ncbi:tyrosine-protein phosphatase [Brochothrix thermosphacta]|uniref:tyrosine-protein phosphatase n=1 Tax=Brochothrix thermosphacta TaxID=2756 RepID=UPI0039B00B14
MKRKIINFRDIGGFSNDSNQFIKEKQIYRAGNLSQIKSISPAFSSYKIATVIDLRTLVEKGYHYTRYDFKNVVNVPLVDKSRQLLNRKTLKLISGKANEKDLENLMIDTYKNMALYCQDEINTIFSLLTEEKNFPLLIHCSAGKDRTGFIVALIQLLLEIPYQIVLTHYLASNDHVTKSLRGPARLLKIISFNRLDDQTLKPITTVRKEYLDAALDLIYAKHSSIEAFLVTDCNMSVDDIKKIKDNLLS